VFRGSALADTQIGGAGRDMVHAGGGADCQLNEAADWGHDMVGGFIIGRTRISFAIGRGVTQSAPPFLNSAHGNRQVGCNSQAIPVFEVPSLTLDDERLGRTPGSAGAQGRRAYPPAPSGGARRVS